MRTNEVDEFHQYIVKVYREQTDREFIAPYEAWASVLKGANTKIAKWAFDNAVLSDIPDAYVIDAYLAHYADGQKQAFDQIIAGRQRTPRKKRKKTGSKS